MNSRVRHLRRHAYSQWVRGTPTGTPPGSRSRATEPGASHARYRAGAGVRSRPPGSLWWPPAAESKQRGLAEQLAQLPKRVPAKGLKTLKTEKKLIVDALKMIAYHCETMLLERLSKHYARADDEGRTLLHAAFQSSARMEVTETELKIWIAAQSSPHRTEAVAKVCQELDAEVVYYPGSNLRLRLAVATQ